MPVPIVIVNARFSIPLPVCAMLRRQRLHDLINHGLATPLTLVSAPTGYGKTSLLTEWLLTTQMHRSCAWISLEPSDNTVHQFWLCVFLALHRCAPNLMSPFITLLQDPRSLSRRDILSLLSNRLLEEEHARYVLVIDDYHFITNSDLQQELTYFIEQLPPQLRLMVATRVDPPFPLHRWRARGFLTEIRTEHLQCTAAETRAFLHEVMELSEISSESEEAIALTEGWLAGLQLIARSIRSQALHAYAGMTTAGYQRYILNYLTEEVFQQQSEDLQRFLLITSLPDQFCASLCDALWDKGRSHQMLEELKRLQLFIVALDEEEQHEHKHPCWSLDLTERCAHTFFYLAHESGRLVWRRRGV